MPGTIEVQDLRVGMFIHLDLGWMSHPFALSSFRIADPEQIQAIRRLGVRRVRWSPERSDFGALSEPAPWDGLIRAADRAEAPDAPQRAGGPDLDAERERLSRLQAEATRRARLARQRRATQLCERQYAEAAQAMRGAHDAVLQQPQRARRDTESLTQALLDKMLVEGEVCVRMLASHAGDSASAHALNVGVISLLLGRALGWSAEEMLELGIGALMHDVGKIELPERVRRHDAQLTAAQMRVYREHVAYGVDHGRRMALGPAALLILAQHHEAADGSGFPRHLTVQRMSAGARIVALVDRYENLCNPGPIGAALTPHEALSTLFAQHRAQLDPAMLNSFIRMMGVYPAGSLVQLTDDRHALVVSVNPSRPLKPVLLVHDPKVAPDDAMHLDLLDEPKLGIRRSLRPNQLPQAAREYLAPSLRIDYFFEPRTANDAELAEEAVA